MANCRIQNMKPACGYRPEGLSGIRLLDYADFDSFGFDGGGLYENCHISGMSHTGNFVEVETPEMANYTSALQNGLYTHKVETFINELSAGFIAQLNLAANRRYLVFFTTNAGRQFVFGYEAGATVSYASQTADGTGTLVTITAVSRYPLFEYMPPWLIVSPARVHINSNGTAVTVRVTTDKNYIIMAKAEWVNVVPASGSGDGTVDVSGTRHRGRSSRSSALTYKAQGYPDVVQSVDQDGMDEFIEVADATVNYEGGIVTIAGKSNAKSVYFEPYTLESPDLFMADGQMIENGQPVPGDPGATREWAFSVQLEVPPNTSAEERRHEIKFTSEAFFVSAFIVQAGSGVVFSVTPDHVHLDSEGNAQQVTVISNVPWIVE